MNILDELKHADVLVEKNKDLTKFSTMKLKSFGDLITVKSKEGLKFVVSTLNESKIKYRVLGWGANILLPKNSSIPYVQLDFPFEKSMLDQVYHEYTLPASVSLAVLTAHASRFGLKGWEVFTGIPATLGGAIFMNAGTNLGEIGSLITEVKMITKDGVEKLIKIDNHSFSYRKNHFVNDGDVIYEATLKNVGVDDSVKLKIRDYLEMRTRTQPLKEATCGCVFKNYQDLERGFTCRAGQFIDIIGLKGFTHNGLRVSSKHANFMENVGESNYDDVMFMIKFIKNELKLQYGVDFSPEVEF